MKLTVKRTLIVGVILSSLILSSCGGHHKDDYKTHNKESKIVASESPKNKEAVNEKNEGEKTMEVANAFMGAMGSGDMETMVGLMHDDMVWANEGDSRLPWIGPWEGKKAILEEFMPAFGEGFKTLKWEPSDALSSGDTAAYFGTMIGETTKSGEQTKEFTYALRVKVKDDKIILWNWFEDSFEVSRAFNAQ